MKIGIITVYDTLNSGGVLQAYVLKKILENHGHEVYHIKTGARNRISMFLKHIHGDIRKKQINISDYIFYCFNIYKFKKMNSLFDLCKMGDEKYNELDMVIVGSDEIWNLSRKVFLKYPIFWGSGIQKKRIAYAPSMNNSTLQDLKKAKYPLEEITKFSSVMVRDTYTKEIVEKIYDKNEINVVVDPTLFLMNKDYMQIEEVNHEDDYIMIYSCGQGIGLESLEKIKKFARQENLKVISVGKYVKGCDKSVAANPFEFLGYMDKAKYVITDTFHGTVFSIIYEKQFVSYGVSKKSEEVLKQFHLERRKIDESGDLEGMLHSLIDYVEVNKCKKELCEKSWKLLECAINK